MAVLNLSQKVFLWAGVLAICAMGVYPPWKCSLRFEKIFIEDTAGYASLFGKPAPRFFPPADINATQSAFKTSLKAHMKPHFRSTALYATRYFINFDQLVIQWVCVALITGALIVTFHRRRD